MTPEVPIPNPPVSREEKSGFAKLSGEDKAIIDNEILGCLVSHWQKVARVVIRAEEKLRSRYPEFSHVFYAERIRVLAKQGRLDSQGNLRYMRFSEVRLPDEN